MPELLRAARILPMTPGFPVLEDAAVVVENHGIVDLGPCADMRARHGGALRDLGDATLAPATFNSHVHLEMSHLLGLTTRGQGFVTWVTSLLDQPLYALDASRVRGELLRMEQRGVGFVADISTHNAGRVGALLAGSGLGFASFREVIGGAAPEDPATLLPQLREVDESGRGTMSVAGHALYSTTPELLRAAKGLCRERGLPFSLHLAEHEDEDAILLRGQSPFLDLLKARGVLSGYTAPEERPVPLAARLGLLDADTLCVHCVTVDQADIATLAESRATVCLCPRSNEYIGEGTAPARRLLDSGANVCLGTDGLCSNVDLDPYGELEFLLAQGLELDLCQAVALVTANPARYFGRGVPYAKGLGSLAPGNPARFSIVPPAVVEACLRS